jgi:hypothetical protein
VLFLVSGCNTDNGVSFDNPLHQSVENVELDISYIESYPDTLSSHEITYIEINHELLKATLTGNVSTSQINLSEDDQDSAYYKTVLKDSSGAYWVAMDGDIHMYTYMKNESAVSSAEMQSAEAVAPETVEQNDIDAAEVLMGKLGLNHMVRCLTTRCGDVTGLFYRYADEDSIVNLDGFNCRLGFNYSYVSVVVEEGIVQSATVFRPYEITGESNPGVVLSPETAATYLLGGIKVAQGNEDTLVLNMMYLAWVINGTDNSNIVSKGELRPYWIFSNADYPEWSMAVDAITGSVFTLN